MPFERRVHHHPTPLRRQRSLFHLALLLIGMLVSCAALAQPSPYAPGHVPEAGTWFGDVSAGWEQTRFDLRSIGVDVSGTSRFLLARAGLSHGLSDQWTLGAGATVAGQRTRNPDNPAERRSGLRSPEVSIQWTANRAPSIRPWARAAVLFNPDNDSVTNRVTALGGVLIGAADDTHASLALEVSYFDALSARLDGAHVELAHPFGDWLATVGGGWAELEPYGDAQLRVGATRFHSLEAGLSRRVGQQLWLGLDVRRQVATAESTPFAAPLSLDTRSTDTVILLSGRWAFSGR